MTAFRKTLVIIDDDPSVRKALARLVEKAGYRVETFASAEEFLGVAAECGADCLIVDVDLGGPISGLDLARDPAVRGLRVPVLFISGSTHEAVRDRAMALGGADYLRKPFPATRLLEAIANAIGPPDPAH
jgi:FixJ family two-component response regulator